MSLLVRQAEVMGRPGVDVRMAGGVVAEVAPRLPPVPADHVVEAGGGALIPGIHDHHVHLRAWAAALGSVQAGPPDVTDLAALGRRLRQAAAGLAPGTWLRAVGYHESVAGLLDRTAVDRLVAERPVRIQHRSGSLWVLNSKALDVAQVERCPLAGVERDGDGRPTGRLWRLDSWLNTALPAAGQDSELNAAGRLAARAGVTGFTDATPDRTRGDLDDLARASLEGVLGQRLHLMCPAGLLPPGPPRVTIGPVKILLDDDRLPALDELTAIIDQAHGAGRRVAIHCVTAVQLVVATAALGGAGPLAGSPWSGDRIEHASVVPPDLIPVLVELGVTVVTQPSFVAERGDQYLDDVDRDEQPWLYRCASLLRAGVPTAFSTDAPFGGYDPWAAIRAASERRTASGRVVGAGERVPAGVGLSRFVGHPQAPACPRQIRVGAPADVCLLRVPWAEAERAPDASLVAVTVVAGSILAQAG